MTDIIPESEYVSLSEPKTKYSAMRDDVNLMYENGRWVSCAILILCYIDSIASEPGNSSKGKFSIFVKKNFPDLFNGLNSIERGKNGGEVLYDKFRNGLTHLFNVKEGYVLARDDEINGNFVAEMEVENRGIFTGINIDLLKKEFGILIEKRLDSAV